MHKYCIPAVLLLLLASCNVREQGTDAPPATFTASLEYGADSRTALDGLDIVWTACDEISVFGNSAKTPERFSIDEEGIGTADASFIGLQVGAAPYYALYPHDGAASMNGTSLSLSLPAVQQYSEAGFAPGAFPMVACSQTSKLEFRNLCGILSIKLTGEGTITSVSITSAAQEALWGKASVDMAYSGEPVLVMEQNDAAHSTLTLDCGDGVELSGEPASFNFIVPAGTLKQGFTLTALDAESGEMVKSTATNLSAARSTRKSMAPLEYLQTSSPFLSINEYGVYDLGGSSPSALRVYAKGNDQLALRSGASESTFRIQSLPLAEAVCVTYPASVSVGSSYSLNLVSYGLESLEDGAFTAVLLKAEDGRLWFKDQAGKRGFIIAGEL